MLTEEQKAQWVADLRSGEFEQCKEELCNGTGYCCLGVLAKQLDPSGSWGLAAFLLDVPMLRDVLTIPQNDLCVRWNDAEDLTFPQIADKIEAGELDGL